MICHCALLRDMDMFSVTTPGVSDSDRVTEGRKRDLSAESRVHKGLRHSNSQYCSRWAPQNVLNCSRLGFPIDPPNPKNVALFAHASRIARSRIAHVGNNRR